MKSKDPYSRICTNCRHSESATANTLFHKVKFGLRKAFLILFELSSTTKDCSSTVMARKYGINQKAAWLFMAKVRKAMESSSKNPINGLCEVDEILVGGKKEGKPGRGATGKSNDSVVVEKDGRGGIKMAYGVGITDFSTPELRKNFDRHIALEAEIETDLWRSYTPLANIWKIKQPYLSFLPEISF